MPDPSRKSINHLGGEGFQYDAPVVHPLSAFDPLRRFGAIGVAIVMALFVWLSLVPRVQGDRPVDKCKVRGRLNGIGIVVVSWNLAPVVN